MTRLRILVVATTAARAETLRAAALGPERDVVVVPRAQLGAAVLAASAAGQAYDVLVLDAELTAPPEHTPMPRLVVEPAQAQGLDWAEALAAASTSRPSPAPAKVATPFDLGHFAAAKRAALIAFEREYLARLLVAHRDNLTAAARAAGLDRKSLWRLLVRHDLRESLPARRRRR